ncbi:MAG: RNA pseudouridine synthase [Spirochaetaceae bacterium]|jgi:23S rRNA pseudouridine1911/1915/1917 synthase|nr:RNA pseudouridine synthase [Spirochaetaceae bacterium]
MDVETNRPAGFPEDRILYAGDLCLTVNKIPGEAMEGAAPGMADLPKLLAEKYPSTAGEKPFPLQAVHRLDVPVSGCALFARTPQSLVFLNAAFAEGRTGKLYWAIVEQPRDNAGISALRGILHEGEDLVHWLAFDRRHNKSRAFAEPGPDRKKGILRCRLCGMGLRYLFLEINLVTGRHHQIRAQLAALGMPVKGDLKYGARRSEKTGGIRLHARSLSFPNPDGTGDPIRVTATPPLRDSLWEAFEGTALD